MKPTSILWLAALVTLGTPFGAVAQLSRHAYDITSCDLNIRPDFETRELSLRERVVIVNAGGATASASACHRDTLM